MKLEKLIRQLEKDLAFAIERRAFFEDRVSRIRLDLDRAINQWHREQLKHAKVVSEPK